MEWRVLHLKPRTEKKVAAICARHRLPHYLPLRRSVRIYPRRKAVFEIPLFPNYLFVAYDKSREHLLFRDNHVVRVLKPPRQMELLRQLVQVRRLLRLDPELESIDPIACGDWVRIKAGPLAGFEGFVTRLGRKPGKRLVVLNVEIVGRAVATETDLAFIERIGSRRTPPTRSSPPHTPGDTP